MRDPGRDNYDSFVFNLVQYPASSLRRNDDHRPLMRPLPPANSTVSLPSLVQTSERGL